MQFPAWHTPLSLRVRIAALLVLAPMCAGVAVGNDGKLIEFGWDEPDTAFLRAHIKDLQASPFDGCVFHVDYRKPDGKKASFTWEAWSTNRIDEAALSGAVDDLRQTRFGRFNQCFLRFNTTPANLDWFDDHAPILAKARLAAKLARKGRLPGVLFDIEQYNGPLFNYRKQRDAKSKSWEVYAAQVRLRGKEVMNSFQEGYPNLTVFLTFGYSLPWVESSRGKGPLADCSYGLLAPFLDGMVDAAKGKARLIDGYELSYGYQQAAEFQEASRTFRTGVLPIVRDPVLYQKFFRLGFGLWLDHDWRKRGWSSSNASTNYFTPLRFEDSVREALRVSDGYVWIYSETPRWWTEPDGRPRDLPPEYADALRRARRRNGP